MAVIFLYFGLFLGVHFLSKQFKRPGAARLFQLIACFILLFGFFGFRDITVLNDTPHYYGAYYKLSRIRSYMDSSIFTYNLMQSFEYGYQVMQHSLIKYISQEPFTIIIVSSFIISWGNISFISGQTKHIALALTMLLMSGVLFDQYCLIRQSLALMIFYKAVEYLRQERVKRYVILVLTAALFHVSILVMLILPIMTRMKISKRNVLIVLGIALVSALVVYQVFDILGLSNTKYFIMTIKRNSFPLAAMFDGLLMLLLIGCCMVLYRRMGMKTIDKTVFWMGVFGICVCIITQSFLSFFRLNVYIWPFIYMTFLQFTDTTSNLTYTGAQHQCIALRQQMLVTVLMILAVRMAIILSFRNEWYHLIPYSFYDFSDQFHNFNMYWEK